MLHAAAAAGMGWGGSVKGSCAGRSVSCCRGHAAAPSNSRIYPFPPRQKVKSTYLSVSRSARLSLSFSRQLYLTLGHMCSLCPGGVKTSQDPPPLHVATDVPSLIKRLHSSTDG